MIPTGATLEQIGEDSRVVRASHGFYTPCRLTTASERDLMLGKLMLVVTEIAEAAEAVRHNDEDNFAEEIADALIRLLDITSTCGIAIEDAIRSKQEKNRNRPFRHNKSTTL